MRGRPKKYADEAARRAAHAGAQATQRQKQQDAKEAIAQLWLAVCSADRAGDAVAAAVIATNPATTIERLTDHFWQKAKG